jgi:hypothetical protein
MVLDILTGVGMGDVSDWFLNSLAPTTLRNYRRGFTLFRTLIGKAGIEYRSIKSTKFALAALIRALREAFIDKVCLSAVSNMRTAMIRVFSFSFDVDLSQSVVISTAMKFYTMRNLPKKESLRLHWSIEQLFTYLKSLQPFKEMDISLLTDVAIVLCIAFTTLRFTELSRLDIFSSNPDLISGVWKFWMHIKGHPFSEQVILHRVEVQGLNPIEVLLELRDRLLLKVKEPPCSCWLKPGKEGDLVPLSYNELRQAALRIMMAAGIKDKRPYHIKHAVLTCLDAAGATMKDIAAFARHKFGSMAAFQHYISYDGGKKSVERLIENVKGGDNTLIHPN